MHMHICWPAGCATIACFTWADPTSQNQTGLTAWHRYRSACMGKELDMLGYLLSLATCVDHACMQSISWDRHAYVHHACWLALYSINRLLPGTWWLDHGALGSWCHDGRLALTCMHAHAIYMHMHAWWSNLQRGRIHACHSWFKCREIDRHTGNCTHTHCIHIADMPFYDRGSMVKLLKDCRVPKVGCSFFRVYIKIL